MDSISVEPQPCPKRRHVICGEYRGKFLLAGDQSLDGALTRFSSKIALQDQVWILLDSSFAQRRLVTCQSVNCIRVFFNSFDEGDFPVAGFDQKSRRTAARINIVGKNAMMLFAGEFASDMDCRQLAAQVLQFARRDVATNDNESIDASSLQRADGLGLVFLFPLSVSKDG